MNPNKYRDGKTVVMKETGNRRVSDIGNRRELFLDDFLVEEQDASVRRVFHQPVPRQIVMTFDAAWEGNSCGKARTLRDAERYRMLYRASGYTVVDGKLKMTMSGRYAYAESPNGIAWTRPDLGLTEFEGSTSNNLLPDNVNFAFEDTRPGVEPAARYKGISLGVDHRGEHIGGGYALYAWQSPDAIHWTRMQEGPIYDKHNRGLGALPDKAVMGWLDSANTVFWSPTEKRYVLYYRVYTYEGKLQTPEWKEPEDYWKRNVRQVEKAVSSDFLTWERVGLVEWGDDFPTVREQIYNNGIAPYRRAPHLLIAMLNRYSDRGWTKSHDALPDLERRTLESSVEMRSGTALTDTLLGWSRDGMHFTRSPDVFLAPGPERNGSWMYGDHWAVNHLVETPSPYPGGEPELSIYAMESYRKGPHVQMRRYSLRLDGFASLHAGHTEGAVVTKPLCFSGAALRLNVATSAAGSLDVEILNTDGTPHVGFSRQDCDSIIGDTTDRVVSWQGRSDLSKLTGKPVRLRFTLREADIYALRFGKKEDE